MDDLIEWDLMNQNFGLGFESNENEDGAEVLNIAISKLGDIFEIDGMHMGNVQGIRQKRMMSRG